MGTYHPVLAKINFLSCPTLIARVGLRDLQYEFEMGVATKSRYHFRVCPSKYPQSAMAAPVRSWICCGKSSVHALKYRILGHGLPEQNDIYSRKSIKAFVGVLGLSY